MPTTTLFKRRLYKRGSSYETTIPMPLLFALDKKNKKYNVVFSYDPEANKWYVQFEEREQDIDTKVEKEHKDDEKADNKEKGG